MMETHKITGLIVVDDQGRAVGALNIHELLGPGGLTTVRRPIQSVPSQPESTEPPP